MTLLLIIETALLIVAIYVVRNLLFKNEALEDILNNALGGVQSTLDEMRKIDLLGSFESDDEVGGTFHALEDIVQDLVTFLSTGEDDITE